MAKRQHTIGKAKTFKRTVSFEHAGSTGEHTSGKASFKGAGEHTSEKGSFKGGGEHTGRITSSKRAKHAGLVDPLEAANEILRRATERAGNPVEKLVKDQIAGLNQLNSILQKTSELLGGRKILGSAVESELDAHELLHHGLPRAALNSLVDKLHVISVDEASEALGVSVRTLQRHKHGPVARLDVPQSGRAWRFAEILAKATRVLGSQEEAEQWLKHPAIGLDRQRPVDLLTTPAGTKLVETYLGRLEYGVYT
jgi:putative toxin-antitoxin system antitoxin component (TIGR02293 family)